MDRSELEQASHEELVELLLQMHETLQDVRETNRQLTERVHELEAEQKRPKKTSKNSSSRPSSERKSSAKGVKKGQKRGPKAGHRGCSRERSEPDVLIECKVEACPDCGSDLSQVPHQELGRSQVIEIPPVEPVVVEAVRYGCQCPACGEDHEAAYPEGLEPKRVFGNRIETIVTYLHEVQHVSYKRLQVVLHVLFGLVISCGALVNISRRAAAKLEPATAEIRQKVQASAVVLSDETGARIDGKNHWQWVFVGDDATYHVIADNRSAQVIQDVMGDAVPLVWVSDLFSSQGTAKSTLRQVCLAHQVRDLQFAIDAECSAWAYHFRQLLFRAQRLEKRRAELPLARFYAAVAQIETACDALLRQPLLHTEESRLQRRYIKHRASLFTFLYLPSVPADNNASERALRNSVIHRKVSGGFRSQTGADVHATVTSIVDTAKQNDEQPFDALAQRIGQPTPVSA